VDFKDAEMALVEFVKSSEAGSGRRAKGRARGQK